MAKTKAVYLTTNVGMLAYAYIAKPDDEAPPGATWKPDGRFKGFLVFDTPEEAAEARAEAIRVLREKYPQAPEDEDLLILPVRPGEALGGKKAEEFAGKTTLYAASDFRPAVYDATGQKVPDGVFAYSGDRVRFKVSLFPFDKTEKVRNGKRTEDVTVYGCSFRLAALQIVEKKPFSGGFDAVEGGYEARPEDARPERETRKQERTERTERSGAASGDF